MKKSYRRPVPNKEEITDEKVYDIKNCPDCGNKLSKIKILEFYEQDIIPMQEWFKKLKKTILIKITTGYCKHCKKRISAIPIPKQKAYIGKNIKQLVVYQTTVQQLSNSQIIDFLESHLHFQISTGEIAHILSEQAIKLKPALDKALEVKLEFIWMKQAIILLFTTNTAVITHGQPVMTLFICSEKTEAMS